MSACSAAPSGLFRSGYSAFLVQNWIPALDGVAEKLERGAKVADVGCGHGASTVLMARAFPNSSFVGFDFHEPSIRRARAAALSADVAANTRFEVAKAKTFPGSGYDLIACFARHGRPEGRRRPYPPGPQTRRHVPAGGAVRGRRAGGGRNNPHAEQSRY
jgi:SAM-dependent methyltransferase